MTFAQKYGPWAVISGASEGVGRSFALELARRGVASVLVARREAPLRALATEIREATGIECVTVSADLSDPESAATVASAVGEREVGLYISNAGADTNHSRFLDADLAAWNLMLQRNVSNMVASVHKYAGPMRERGHGGILLINSGACYAGAAYMAMYAASKAFTLTFAEGLWCELAPQGVDVLTFVLGQTDTPAYRALLTEVGKPFPTDWASPDAVAAEALAKLDKGPVQNMGFDENEEGVGPTSPAARRQRSDFISQMAAASTFEA
jgi:short-subunit dehydrogenase